MKVLRNTLTISVTFFLCSCMMTTDKINYGNDECFFCKMLIVDKRFGSKIITKKGKTYKFDSIECMIDFLNNSKKNTIQKIFVTDYSSPGIMIKASQANYLKSKNIPTPMGGFIAAIKEKRKAHEIQTEKGGELFSWDKLIKKPFHYPIY